MKTTFLLLCLVVLKLGIVVLVLQTLCLFVSDLSADLEAWTHCYLLSCALIGLLLEVGGGVEGALPVVSEEIFYERS